MITTEIRADVPKNVVDIFDAISFANGDKSRNVEIIKALTLYAEHQAHVAMMINKVTAGNPLHSDGSRHSGGKD